MGCDDSVHGYVPRTLSSRNKTTQSPTWSASLPRVQLISPRGWSNMSLEEEDFSCLPLLKRGQICDTPSFFVERCYYQTTTGLLNVSSAVVVTVIECTVDTVSDIKLVRLTKKYSLCCQLLLTAAAIVPTLLTSIPALPYDVLCSPTEHNRGKRNPEDLFHRDYGVPAGYLYISTHSR